jgi:hypothetical protein
MPIRGSPNGARHPRPQAGRDPPEWVVAINRNAWSQSIGTGGRDHPVRARRGSAYPRISILPAMPRVPPSWQQACGPCRQASSVRSNGRREIDTAFSRGLANFDSARASGEDIPSAGLRDLRDVAGHHFVVLEHCSVGVSASAWRT